MAVSVNELNATVLAQPLNSVGQYSSVPVLLTNITLQLCSGSSPMSV